MAKVQPTPRQQAILATAWHDDLATLTDAIVRISRSLDRLLQLVEETIAEERQKEATPGGHNG